MKASALLPLVPVCAALALVAGPARAEIASGSEYVALGSSYAAGPGLLPMVDTGCARSSLNYPSLVARRLGLSLRDVTCSSATTADILSRSQRTPVGSVPPQIDAVGADTRLVTVTIGGNDLGYVGSLTGESCANALTSAATLAARLCGQSPGAITPTTAADLDAVRQSLTDLVTTIRQRAPQTTVMLVDYLPVFDQDASACAVVPVTPEQAAALHQTYSGLQDATAAAGAATGALVVHPSEDPAHTPCGPVPWTAGFELPDPAAGKGLAYHPTAAGMAALAESVTAAIGSAQ